jgi:hypothetical protein
LKENEIKNLKDAIRVLEVRTAELDAAHKAIDQLTADLGLERTKSAQVQGELEKLRREKQVSDTGWAQEKTARIRAEGERDTLNARPQAPVAAPDKPVDEPRVPQQSATPAPDKPTPRPVRPLRLGLPVGIEGGLPGGLCCFVRDRTGKRYLLGLASVLGGPGSAVLQPPPQQGGTAVDQVALVSRVGNDGAKSGALAEIGPGIGITTNVPQLGRMGDVENSVFRGDKIVLVRSGGRLARGRVLAVDGAVVIVDIPFTPGDLGAPVLKDSQNLGIPDHDLIGLVYGAADGKSYVIHINHVLADLRVELIDDQGRPRH